MFSKNGFVVALKDKKRVTVTNAFQSILNNSKRKPNKMWTDQGSEFYNSFKKMLQENGIIMYSTHSEGKSIVAERFARTLKNNIYKHMKAASKNAYFNVLNDIVDEYNNTYQKTNKMKPIDVKSDSFAAYTEESNEKDPKFKVAIMSGFQSIKIFLLKDTVLTGVKRFLLLKKLKIRYLGLM